MTDATVAPIAPVADDVSPLRQPLFRALWIATIVSNVGTWMNDVGAGWLMTSLSSDPLLVALVQAATTLPMFLLALPGGALADIVDRRRLLIGAQVWSLIAATCLAVVVALGLTTPAILLALTFAIAAGASLSAPAFQAIVPELVPAKSLPDAVSLNSLGINIARAIGPALGGVVISLSGPASVFALNAVSVVGVMFVLYRWKRVSTATKLPPEHFFGALRAGARYARHSPSLQIVLVRSIGFFLFASAAWALLPIIARRELGLGPSGYGGILGCMGAGAIVGASVLPVLRKRLSPNGLTIGATVIFALVTFALSQVRGFASAGIVMAFAGLAWIAMLSSLNVAAQLAAPSWVKARALSVYLVVFQGAMTAGSILWGLLAARTDIQTTLTVASILMLAALLLVVWFPIGGGTKADLTPSRHWVEPDVDDTVGADRGPVMIMVEYAVDPARVAEFTMAMHRLSRVRKRDGAMRWELYEDATRPGVIVETFVVESWLEHLRQHERVTKADRIDQDTVRAFHIGADLPIVRHLWAPKLAPIHAASETRS
ncbi:MFS transporter [Aurantimonas sp. 22II-16-19i]|uniref:MFS transporter n=1 Tax=Aurantimonas sp. 22II-16-19i TaxID=1317114 RepID=UPI0009F7E0D9|nr:MFS transporter [Aurantimonas sp. 22II-16-19i]ORE93322.1 hypothetical protein ATO4_16285 [Aurantimonas sp. 22II-16-19i]